MQTNCIQLKLPRNPSISNIQWAKSTHSMEAILHWMCTFSQIIEDVCILMFLCGLNVWLQCFIHQVMPYSTGCKTPLSNFEAGQNYKVWFLTWWSHNLVSICHVDFLIPSVGSKCCCLLECMVMETFLLVWGKVLKSIQER